MFEYCIRSCPPGRQQFTRSHSFSHHHDHHRYHYRTRCSDDCAGISNEKWNSLREQKKGLIERNEVLTRENQTLKYDLQASTQENSRLLTYNQQMLNEIEELKRTRALDAETAERFRRRVQAIKLEVDQKDKDIQGLKKENDILSKRVCVMTETISDQNQRIMNYKKRQDDYQATLDEVNGRLEKAKRILAARRRDLDERNAQFDEQYRILRRYETSSPPRRRCSFV
ncbi:hypothetical protein F5Y00DRAFT_257202 [Daldinia vernicosa]|uniref:uncharacterized protein n=1 Tax=Daldinia vernicosa TaxID=114800 RepID=UPI002008064B|nr:uncharacterized protein F5Y00DRAFT_257202 [Daldinia vernicosa]KAI0853902.1 hypothetical protein F5Y00DRAFT_257202 [Daldinia vernicosa]